MVTPARSSSSRTAGNVARRGAANRKNGSAGTKSAKATPSRITFFIFAAIELVVCGCALFGPEADNGGANAAASSRLFVAILSIIAAWVAAVVARHHIAQSIAGAGRL